MNEESTSKQVYAPQVLYTPQQVVGVQQLDLSSILNLMIMVVVIVMIMNIVGSLFKSTQTF